jgi:hypothetical protein
MKFEVTINDFWLEEEELSEALQKAIKNDVLSQIRDSVKKQVSEFMDSHIKSTVDAELKTRVQLLMDDIISSGKIKGQYSSDPEITVSEWIKKKFTAVQSDIKAVVEKQVKLQVTELQQRYDLFFATQLISKMKEAGFMKEDVDKILSVAQNHELTS